MYVCGISHSSRERATSWNTTIRGLMLAGGCLAFTAGAEPGPRERESKQSREADELAALQRDAPVVAIEPEPPQARRECREMSITDCRIRAASDRPKVRPVVASRAGVARRAFRKPGMDQPSLVKQHRLVEPA